jgi:hypothetical protein
MDTGSIHLYWVLSVYRTCTMVPATLTKNVTTKTSVLPGARVSVRGPATRST